MLPVDPFPDRNTTPMEQRDGGGATVGDVIIAKWMAVLTCTAMAIFYVAILYSPTLILRLPQANSYKSFMIRRFVCAALSSIVSMIVCSLILPIQRGESSVLFGVYGIRLDHLWQSLVFPLLLTSLMYTGSFTVKLLLIFRERDENVPIHEYVSLVYVKAVILKFISGVVSTASNVSAWRNYFVAPLTEELVFRACMIPLLLSGGFSTFAVIFLCPIFFSLAHLNHLLELYGQQNRSLLKACTVVGFQLAYTVIFGAYASFLLLRTGNVVAPLSAHTFCNFWGLPVIFSRRSGLVSVAFLMGMLCFFYALFPLTSPHLYNGKIDICYSWHGYCSWANR